MTSPTVSNNDAGSLTSGSLPQEVNARQLAEGASQLRFLAGGGEMGERIRAYNWSHTALGDPASWPQSLRSAVSILLPSKAQLILFWGRDFITLYNDGYRPVFGAKHPHVLGLPGRESWSELWEGSGLRGLLEGVLNTGEAFRASDRLFVAERFGYVEETYFDVSYDPVRDESDAVGGIFCIVSETTQRVIGERRLRTLREIGDRTTQTRSVNEACHAAISVLEENRYDLPFALVYLLDANTNVALLTGLTGLPDGHPAAPASIDLNDREPDQWSWPVKRLLETGRATTLDDLTKRFGELPGGSWPEPAHTSLMLPLTKSGQETLAGFLIAGVSPRRALDEDYHGFLNLVAGQVSTAIANARAYEEEKKRADALAEIDRAKTAFFSNVSHEFRTPLTLMVGPLEDALANAHGVLPLGAAKDLAVAHRSALRLLRLVNTLLDFSRIEAGRIEASYEPTDLALFTSELAGVFRSAVEKAGLRLVVDCVALPAPVFVDREMWEKIVLNLLSNAFKFTFEGEISVRLKAVDGRVVLMVEDTGVGIPTEDLPRVFERFHRVEHSRGRTHEGTGIGLSLVRELVTLHGGDVRVDSEIDQGSCFTVTIPLGKSHLPVDRIMVERAQMSLALRGEAVVEEALRWLPSESDGQSRVDTMLEAPPLEAPPPRRGDRIEARILWADDNADMRDYVARLLGERFDVEAVADGQAALEAARANPPDLVLTDVMMPRLDGFGLLREMRADSALRDIPVIMLSARAGEESRIEGVQAGADDYLIKPFSARELLARVEANVKMAALRREADRSIRESEHRIRSFADTAPAMLWVTEPDASCSFLSRRWQEYTGQAMEEALGSGWLNAVHPDDREIAGRIFQEANQRREPFSIDYRLRDANGEYRWCIDSGRPRSDETGAFLGYVGSVIDVHERKQAEEALRESEHRFFLLFEKAAFGAALAKLPGEIFLDVNEKFVEMFGYSKHEATGKTSLELGLNPDPASRAHVLAELERHGSVRNQQVTLRTKSGDERVFLNNVTIVEVGNERLLLSTLQDITDRVLAEAGLLEAETRFRTIVQQTNTGIAQTDLTGRFVLVNQRYCEIVGRSREELLSGLRMQDITHPDDLPRNLEQLENLLGGAGSDFTIEKRYLRPDGLATWVNYSVSVLRDSAGKPQSVLAAVVDITERVLAETTLREVSRQKDAFLAVLGHELRNPLSPMMTAVQLLRLRGIEGREVEILERQVGHLRRLVDDLLDISRITSGKVQLTEEDLDLADIVSRAIETVEPLLERRHHRLQVELLKGIFGVRGDAQRLAQVVTNLLVNAAKYSDEGSTITLRATPSDGMVRFSVRDEGMGIPPEMLDKIFDDFVQQPQTLERSAGGLGLGLSIVRSLVQQHRGRVSARSDGVGRGSEFIVELPSQPISAHTPSVMTPSMPMRAFSGSGERILVVDDNRDAADSMGDVLIAFGHSVEVAYDGASAIRIASVFKPAIALVDIGLPVMDGYELAAQLRTMRGVESVRLVAVTGYGEPADTKRALAAGFDKHLVKPVDLKTLTRLVEELRGALLPQ